MTACKLLLSMVNYLVVMMIDKLTHSDIPQTPGQIATFNTQERFLAQFAGAGTVLKAAKTTGISRETVYAWDDADKYGFRQRLAYAKDDFSEAVEGVLFHEVFGPKPNPLLLIFTAKAHNRAKYGDHVTVTNDNAHELLAAVRGLPSVATVEGEARVVDESGEEAVRKSIER